MPDGEKTYSARVHHRIADIDAASWDACAGDDNPTVGHAFLSVLEESGSVSAETGWLAHHLTIEDGAGAILGVAPCYVKGHSYGEYVFDWGWADAYERAGGKYYPKLQVAVPFTPVTGPRLMARPGPEHEGTIAALLAGLIALAKEREVSSLHITFPTASEWRRCGEAGLMQRIGQQFHWSNAGYASFEGFLAALSSRKRKAIRKERSQANAGATIETLTGADIEERHIEAFYSFYLNTVERKWAHAYLTRRFFTLLRERMAEKIVLVMARDGQDFVGGALNILGRDTLYGRNWGCNERYKMLYFEACFYRAIDFAIARGLARVEAGAQGPHKISRGYLPSETYSAHWIRDASLRRAVADFLAHERRKVASDIAALGEASPFRKDGGEGDEAERREA